MSYVKTQVFCALYDIFPFFFRKIQIRQSFGRYSSWSYYTIKRRPTITVIKRRRKDLWFSERTSRTVRLSSQYHYHNIYSHLDISYLFYCHRPSIITEDIVYTQFLIFPSTSINLSFTISCISYNDSSHTRFKTGTSRCRHQQGLRQCELSNVAITELSL